MTLPSSGALSLNDVRGEFGGPTSNVTVGTYYRNGTYVYNVSKNLGVPTSGQIDFADWYGTEGSGAYAKGTCGSAATGGKASVTHNGIDSVGLFTSTFGSWADSSVTFGSTGRTVRSFISNQSVNIVVFHADFNVSGPVVKTNFFQIFSTSALLCDADCGSSSQNGVRETFDSVLNYSYGPNSPVLGQMPNSGVILLQGNKGSFT